MAGSGCHSSDSTSSTASRQTAPRREPVDVFEDLEAVWLRLERSGTDVAAFRSEDGQSWSPFGSVRIAGLGTGPVLVGLGVSAADYGDGYEARGRFTSVGVLEAANGVPAPLELASQSIEAPGFGIDAVYPNPLRDRASILAYRPQRYRANGRTLRRARSAGRPRGDRRLGGRSRDGPRPRGRAGRSLRAPSDGRCDRGGRRAAGDGRAVAVLEDVERDRDLAVSVTGVPEHPRPHQRQCWECPIARMPR